jgi:hypothetical protein
MHTLSKATKANIKEILEALQTLEELGGTLNLQEYVDTLSYLQMIIGTRKQMAIELLEDELNLTKEKQ